MKRWWLLCLWSLVGCSTAPVYDVMDCLEPGHMYKDRVAPYGGVCTPGQGTLPICPAPAVPTLPSTPPVAVPVVPGPAPLGGAPAPAIIPPPPPPPTLR